MEARLGLSGSRAAEGELLVTAFNLSPRQLGWDLRWETAVLLAALLVACTAWLTVRALRARDRRARVERVARAQTAERAARGVLENAGFVVVAEQVRRAWSVSADGEPISFQLVADYVVERSGQRWVAEVKTGQRALNLRFGPTRRQLLEYREAFGVKGVLLVDAERKSLRQVHFRSSTERLGFRRGLLWLACGVALGVALQAWIGHHGAWLQIR